MTLGCERRAIACASRTRRALQLPAASSTPAKRQQLERDLAIELRIVGGVDDAHAAGAEAIEDHVAPDQLGDGGVEPVVARLRRRRGVDGAVVGAGEDDLAAFGAVGEVRADRLRVGRRSGAVEVGLQRVRIRAAHRWPRMVTRRRAATPITNLPRLLPRVSLIALAIPATCERGTS